jgi:hypothetical protein
MRRRQPLLGFCGADSVLRRETGGNPGYFGLESPVRSTEEYRQLKGKVPLRLSEHWGIMGPMVVAHEGLLDACISASPTLGRTIFKQNAFAQMYGVPLWDESSCWLGIGLAVQAHQAAAYPGIEYTINAAVTAEDDLVKEPFTMNERRFLRYSGKARLERYPG